MTFIFILLTFFYFFLVILFVQTVIKELQREREEKLKEVNRRHADLLSKKEALYEEKLGLEDEALKIFMLYEITKDITKSLSEKEAFEILKKKLNQNITFEDCLLLDPESEKVKVLRKSDEYFVFTLQGKRRRIGYLAIKGMSEVDKEKFMILGHQFALGLRRVKLYQEIELIAITDSLTNLHTRRYCMERFQEELERSKMRKIQLSILMIDVDFFKKFNDNFGHLTGDQILREIGTIIMDNIREIDIAGRFGGEEFFIVLPDTDQDGARYVAERIRRATEEATIKAYDTNVKATISIGVATFPENGKKKEELLDKADWALYRSKKMGRNKVSSFGVYLD